MLGLFKRTKIEAWEIELLRNTIRSLPLEYKHLEKQIDEGMLRGVLIGLGDLPGYVAFTYNPKIAKSFEEKQSRGYKLTNIKVLDLKSKKYLEYSIYISTGRINGYSILGAKKFTLDVHNVNVKEFRKEFRNNPDYQKIVNKLNVQEKKAINPDEVYEVILDGKSYFYIKDLEDGDFIGMDYEKNMYEITQDPFEIKLIKDSLLEILK